MLLPYVDKFPVHTLLAVVIPLGDSVHPIKHGLLGDVIDQGIPSAQESIRSILPPYYRILALADKEALKEMYLSHREMVRNAVIYKDIDKDALMELEIFLLFLDELGAVDPELGIAPVIFGICAEFL